MAPSGQATPINSSIPFSSPLFTLQILLLPEVPTSNRNIFYRRYLEIETQHTPDVSKQPLPYPRTTNSPRVSPMHVGAATHRNFFLVPTDRPFPNHPPNWDNPSPFRPLDPVVPVLSFYRPHPAHFPNQSRSDPVRTRTVPALRTSPHRATLRLNLTGCASRFDPFRPRVVTRRSGTPNREHDRCALQHRHHDDVTLPVTSP